jgi:VWFA-related protein
VSRRDDRAWRVRLAGFAALAVTVMIAGVGPAWPAFQSGPDATNTSPPGAPVPSGVFGARSDLVLVHARVVGEDGVPVDDLPVSAFRVLEDGVPQVMAWFHAGHVPLAAGLVIDNSSSMLPRQRMLVAGIGAFASLSRPGDELFTLVFNERVWSGLPPGVPFTHSDALLRTSLARAPVGGKSALHDAVIDALDHLERTRNAERVLVVLADGEDNASRHTRDEMLRRAVASQAPIQTVWTGDLSAASGDRGLLRRLAALSGGHAYTPRTEDGVVTALTTLAATARHGYTMGYVPTNAAADGTFRRIRVLVDVPGRQLRVGAREGYTARSSDDHER